MERGMAGTMEQSVSGVRTSEKPDHVLVFISFLLGFQKLLTTTSFPPLATSLNTLHSPSLALRLFLQPLDPYPGVRTWNEAAIGVRRDPLVYRTPGPRPGLSGSSDSESSG